MRKLRGILNKRYDAGARGIRRYGPCRIPPSAPLGKGPVNLALFAVPTPKLLTDCVTPRDYSRRITSSSRDTTPPPRMMAATTAPQAATQSGGSLVMWAPACDSARRVLS